MSDPHEHEARARAAQLAEALRRDADKATGAAAERLREAAAMIEGHIEAFAVVVRDKRGIEAELKRFQGLLRGAYDMIAEYAQGKRKAND
ncbi:hypothetical protein CIW54_07445 [Paraburkholderia sp. T12-10]|nr:hypothetical protein CIW54_07445 [Paraburkholderia sp. T12-10]